MLGNFCARANQLTGRAVFRFWLDFAYLGSYIGGISRYAFKKTSCSVSIIYPSTYFSYSYKKISYKPKLSL
jgi:hypothetical protein